MQVQIRNHMGDRANSLVFVRALLRNPRQLAAVAPSSRVLDGLTTAEILPCSAPIIELGA
jgi:phospholipid N-methyltransferase